MKIRYMLLLMIFLAAHGFSQLAISQPAGNPVSGDSTTSLRVDQPNNPPSASALPAGQVIQTPDQSVSVIVYPNPFRDKTTFHYFLRKPLVVSIELFDMTGKTVKRMVDKQLQTEGLHDGEISAAELNLNRGIYYIRFTFDQQVVVQKISRI